MSGLNFSIPGALLAGLYKDTLIASDAHAPSTEKPAEGANVPSSEMKAAGADVPERNYAAQGRQAESSGAASYGIQSSGGSSGVVAQGVQAGAGVPASINSLGNNAKGIVILVKDTQNVHLAEDALQLLSGILAACRLNMGDVALVNISRNPFNFSQIRQQLQVNYCFLFDISMQEMQLAFAIPPFQVFAHDSCTFLSSPALHQMLGSSENAKLLKSKLWLCLKNIFNI